MSWQTFIDPKCLNSYDKEKIWILTAMRTAFYELFQSSSTHKPRPIYLPLFVFGENKKKRYHSGLTSTHSSVNKSSLSLSFFFCVYISLLISHTLWCQQGIRKLPDSCKQKKYRNCVPIHLSDGETIPVTHLLFLMWM